MPGHVDYFASATIYFASPGHHDGEEPERLRRALEDALNATFKERGLTFRAAGEHRVDSVEVNKVGATLEGVRRALGKEK